MVTEIMAREECGLLAVPNTVPVLRVVYMSVLQSYSQVKHIHAVTSLSTDVTVTEKSMTVHL